MYPVNSLSYNLLSEHCPMLSNLNPNILLEKCQHVQRFNFYVMVTLAKTGILQVYQLKHVTINWYVVMFQASALLHKMHTLQLSRKYVKSITPEKKAQVGLYIFTLLVEQCTTGICMIRKS